MQSRLFSFRVLTVVITAAAMSLAWMASGPAALPAAAAHEIPGPGRVITRADLGLPEPAAHQAGCGCARCLPAPFLAARK